jgi:hypothetical protein
MTVDGEALREQYLVAIEQEIVSGRRRLSEARHRGGDRESRRAEAVAAVADVTLDWLEAERDRLRAGGAFDEAAARRLLARQG